MGRGARPAAMPAFASLERAVECAAVNQQILASDVAGMRGAQESTGSAELVRISESPGRNAGDAVRSDLVDALAPLFCSFVQRTAQAVGVESARQDIVDGHVLVRHRTCDSGQEGGQAGARPR